MSTFMIHMIVVGVLLLCLSGVVVNSFIRDAREAEAYQNGWDDAMGQQRGDHNGL